MTASTANCVSGVGNANALNTVAAGLFGNWLAGGLVKTEDTGQRTNSDWGANGSGGGVVLGYQIWRFNDALQAQAPIYIKMEMGTGSLYCFGCWITIGTGSDGAGNITGILLARTQFACSSNGGASAYASYFSSNPGRVQAALFIGQQYVANAFILSIERSKDTNGNDTADGVAMTVVWSGNRWSTYLPFARAAKPAAAALHCIPQGALGSLMNGTIAIVFPVYPIDYSGILNPIMGFLAYYSADWTQQTQNGVSLYGNGHNYIALGASAPTATAGWTSSSLAMRYE